MIGVHIMGQWMNKVFGTVKDNVFIKTDPYIMVIGPIVKKMDLESIQDMMAGLTKDIGKKTKNMEKV